MLDIETFFDANFYVETNPDIARSLGSGTLQNPFDQFIKSGQFEGRDPNPFFDTDFYLDQNPDVKAAVLSGNFTAIGHFIAHGQFESRDPSPVFDTSLYLQQNPDVRAAVERDEITGIAHYLEFGRSEGRSQPIADRAGNTFSDAVILDNLTGLQTFRDSVGERDPQDIYGWNLTASSQVNLTLSELNADADLAIVQDRNQNGKIDLDETLGISAKTGTTPESLSPILAPGTYYAVISNFQGNTPYNFTLSTTPLPVVPDSAGNSLAEAMNLGTLTGNLAASDFVGDADIRDIYRFSVDTASELNLELNGMTADADVRLIQDVSNNGNIDPGEIITLSQKSGNSREAIAQVLQAGTYFIVVSQFDGNTNYNLNLSTTVPTNLPPDSAGNALSAAREIGVLSGTQTFTDFVGRFDLSDVYRFSLDAPRNFSLTVDGLTADADVSLSQDLNNNGSIDSNEVLRFASAQGTAPEQISGVLLAGTYAVVVSQFEGDTNYNLTLSATT